MSYEDAALKWMQGRRQPTSEGQRPPVAAVPRGAPINLGASITDRDRPCDCHPDSGNAINFDFKCPRVIGLVETDKKRRRLVAFTQLAGPNCDRYRYLIGRL
jgi:hypothetical protein